MILHADLPEDLAAVPARHRELQRVVVSVLLQDAEADVSMDRDKMWGQPEGISVMWTYSRVGSQLDQEPFAFEAEFANLGPVEGVDLCVPLKKGDDE